MLTASSNLSKQALPYSEKLTPMSNQKQTELNITSLVCTPSDATIAFMTCPGRFRHISQPNTLKNAPDDFCASAWLCTGVNARLFWTEHAMKPTKVAFSGAVPADATR